MTITQLFKNNAVNGNININSLLKIANDLDTEREKTCELLKECERNVGMYLGEKINAHLATMNGTYFSEKDYNYEKPHGEQ